MIFLYNDPKLKRRRKDLRQAQTPEEKLLWAKLRAQAMGYKFFRQYSVGGYILDFYCPVKRVGVELDGEHHKLDQKYDKFRDEYLLLNDIKVLRFWNKEINGNIENVLKKISNQLTSS